MGATFTLPRAFTVVSASTSVSTAPASNLNLDHPAKVWRASAAGATFVVLDLGAGASFDTIALIGGNLAAGDTWRIRTGTANTGTGAYDSGTIAAVTGIRPFTSKSILYTPAARTERYVRIDIVSSATLELQRVVVGTSIVTAGIDWEADQAVIDTSNVETNLGYDVIEDGAKKVRWKITTSMPNAIVWRTQWLGMLSTAGKKRGILFNPFAEDAATYQSDAVFGRIRNDVSASIPGAEIRVVELTIEGLAL